MTRALAKLQDWLFIEAMGGGDDARFLMAAWSALTKLDALPPEQRSIIEDAIAAELDGE
jgi:hypothetical protein